MNWIPTPSKKPTPSEYAVLVWFVAIVFIILGVVAIVIAMRAPAENHDLAVQLEYRGAWCIGIGLGIVFVHWLFRRLTN